MSARKSNRWFARGAGCVTRYAGAETLLFSWHGRPDGAARFVPHVNRYTRNGAEYNSLAALLRAIEAEHRGAAC